MCIDPQDFRQYLVFWHLIKSQCYLEHIKINPVDVSCLKLKPLTAFWRQQSVILLDNYDVKHLWHSLKGHIKAQCIFYKPKTVMAMMTLNTSLSVYRQCAGLRVNQWTPTFCYCWCSLWLFARTFSSLKCSGVFTFKIVPEKIAILSCLCIFNSWILPPIFYFYFDQYLRWMKDCS